MQSAKSQKGAWLWHFIDVGGGGGLTETTLWTNSSPTSDFASSTQTISSLSDYKYIKIYWKPYKSSSGNLGEMLIPIDIFKTMTDANTSYIPSMAFGSRNSSGDTYLRRVFYVSATQVKFTTSQKPGSSGSSASYCIPTQITGLK